MTSKPKRAADDERALRVLEAIHGEPEDIDPDVPIDQTAIARMRHAIDRAFDRAWKTTRQQAKADSERATRTAGFLRLSRDAVIAQIEAWQVRLGPSLQLAHRQLEVMDDDDLRTLLSDIEEVAERKGFVS